MAQGQGRSITGHTLFAVAVLAMLQGCAPCPADSTEALNALSEPVPEGVHPSEYLEFDKTFVGAVVRLREGYRGKRRRFCGARYTVGPGLTDEALIADWTRKLGPGWGAPEKESDVDPAVTIYRWQSQCSTRTYAVLTYAVEQKSVKGEVFRPLWTNYNCGDD